MTDVLVQEVVTVPMTLVAVTPISVVHNVFRFERVNGPLGGPDDRLYLEATEEELKGDVDETHPYAEFEIGQLFHVTLSRVVPKHDG